MERVFREGGNGRRGRKGGGRENINENYRDLNFSKIM